VTSGRTIDQDGHVVYSGMWWALALPGVILTVNGLLAVATLGLAYFGRELGLGKLGLGVLAGFAVWTLFEYLLHRFVLHHTRIGILRRVFWRALHQEHHEVPGMREPDYHSIHLAISLPALLLVVVVTALASRTGHPLAIAGGWCLGYCAYEWIHMVIHTQEPGERALRVPFLGFLYRTHTMHHFENASRNYGFSTTFWDRVFGSFSPPRD